DPGEEPGRGRRPAPPQVVGQVAQPLHLRWKLDVRDLEGAYQHVWESFPKGKARERSRIIAQTAGPHAEPGRETVGATALSRRAGIPERPQAAVSRRAGIDELLDPRPAVALHVAQLHAVLVLLGGVSDDRAHPVHELILPRELEGEVDVVAHLE